ncbi:transcriptional regulator [Novosphingobium sp. PY1]|nr:transcriptional regulator [Novosphingobium sp. PY1]
MLGIVLEDDPVYLRPDHRKQLFVVHFHGQDDHGPRIAPPAQFRKRRNAVTTGHAHIEQDDVRILTLYRYKRFIAVAGHGDDFVPPHSEYGFDTQSKKGMIVGN